MSLWPKTSPKPNRTRGRGVNAPLPENKKGVSPMVIELSAQTIITAGAVLTAIGIILGLIVKGVNWFNRQNAQDERLDAQDKKLKDLEQKHNDDMALAQEENRLIIEALLACLQAHQADGHNGPVTENIKNINDYLNRTAHQRKE